MNKRKIIKEDFNLISDNDLVIYFFLIAFLFL